jgi:hypothetical protein
MGCLASSSGAPGLDETDGPCVLARSAHGSARYSPAIALLDEASMGRLIVGSGAWLVALACGAAAAAEPVAPAARFVVLQDGAAILDQQSKLVWVRCVEGMRWTGLACTGEPKLATHAEAMALAKARRESDGLAWRLARVPELRQLASNKARPPGLDAKFFPAAPAGWHWSGTASVDAAPVNPYDYGNVAQGRTAENANRVAFLHGWAVNLDTGVARGDVTKATRLPVRLVRSGS